MALETVEAAAKAEKKPVAAAAEQTEKSESDDGEFE